MVTDEKGRKFRVRLIKIHLLSRDRSQILLFDCLEDEANALQNQLPLHETDLKTAFPMNHFRVALCLCLNESSRETTHIEMCFAYSFNLMYIKLVFI